MRSRQFLLQLIIENVVTCFFGKQCTILNYISTGNPWKHNSMHAYVVTTWSTGKFTQRKSAVAGQHFLIDDVGSMVARITDNDKVHKARR